ncbi:MAG TPA: tetratricopeptide repeat protein [Spirochaetota bacterium]|nr:tetratricopeptide repeat protein [Spirochaetota bacterium]
MRYFTRSIRIIQLSITCLSLHSTIYPRENSSELYRLGEKEAISGNYDNAEKFFNEVIRLSPSFVLGHYGLGKLYLYKEGKTNEAEKELEKACILDKHFSKAHFYLGLSYFYQKKYIAAIHAFNEAYNTDKTCIESLYNIGVIYDLMDNSLKSKKYFKLWKSHKSKLDTENET